MRWGAASAVAGLLAFAAIALSSACGGTAQQQVSGDSGAGSGDVGSPTLDAMGDVTVVVNDGGPGAGCSALAACCTTLAGATQSLCQDVVAAGNASDCATELAQLRAEGECVPDGSTTVDAQRPPPPPPPFDAAFDSPPPPPPPGCSNMTCTPPLVCNTLPGGNAGSCVSPCATDADCPAWTTCQAGGLCSPMCSSCPAGEQCSFVGMPRPGPCTSSAQCSLGNYCESAIGMCNPYLTCVACTGGCLTCTTNGQCNAGQVCVNQMCTTCTSNAQCGPSAQCTATHMGMQCTCTLSTDCAAGETCSSGLCSSPGITGCELNGCPMGQACINNVCGPCSTFMDCNTQPLGAPQPPSGFACINGVCTNCTANSQCGGAMACVAGTCGTCSTNTQCGANGVCTDGFCTCTSNAQCDTGQRCGSGVCVAM